MRIIITMVPTTPYPNMQRFVLGSLGQQQQRLFTPLHKASGPARPLRNKHCWAYPASIEAILGND